MASVGLARPTNRPTTARAKCVGWNWKIGSKHHIPSPGRIQFRASGWTGGPSGGHNETLGIADCDDGTKFAAVNAPFHSVCAWRGMFVEKTILVFSFATSGKHFKYSVTKAQNSGEANRRRVSKFQVFGTTRRQIFAKDELRATLMLDNQGTSKMSPPRLVV